MHAMNERLVVGIIEYCTLNTGSIGIFNRERMTESNVIGMLFAETRIRSEIAEFLSGKPWKNFWCHAFSCQACSLKLERIAPGFRLKCSMSNIVSVM